METLFDDLRLAVRVLLRNRGLTAVILLTLAVGIGANSAIFTVVNAVLLRSLPYTEPDRLVMVFEQNLPREWRWFSVSRANYQDWREASSFEELAAFSLYEQTGYNLTGGARAERLSSTGVTANFFDVFGVQPLVGRTFGADEAELGKHQVVVLSHRLWQRRFGGDRGIVGRDVELDGEPYRVIGVMKPTFRFPATAEFWLPLAWTPEQASNRLTRPLNTVGRLRDGTSLEQAQAEMSNLSRRLAEQYPETNEDFGSVIYTLFDRVVGNVQLRLVAVFVLAALVLLIACANVAGLLLARSVARQKEFALRIALGAGRRLILRQLAVESLLLSLLGGLLGLGLAIWSCRLLVAAAPSYLPRLEEISVDGRVLAFTLLLSLVAGALFGLIPALQISRTELYEILKEGGRSAVAGKRGHWLRHLLVLGEVAGTTVVLLVTAGFVLNLWNLLRVDPGFDPRGVFSAEVALPSRLMESARPYTEFFRQVLERMEALPGVETAALTTSIPLGNLPLSFDFFPESNPPQSLAAVASAEFRAVSRDYFQAMRIPLLSGRGFTAQDREDAPCTVLVNQTLARRFLEGDPLGDRLVIGNLLAGVFPELPLTCEVVGVVGDVKQAELHRPAEAVMYLHYLRFSRTPHVSRFLVARTGGRPLDLTGGVRQIVEQLDRDLPLYNVQSMEQRLAASVADSRFTALLLAAFGAAALFLAGVGVYGLLAFSVGERVGEIGMRIALGARPADLLRGVLFQGLRLGAAGVVLGLLATFLVQRLLGQTLADLNLAASFFDPRAVLTITAFVLLVVTAACLVPAGKAARVDPMTALRQQ